jgi:hypothetical protein
VPVLARRCPYALRWHPHRPGQPSLAKDWWKSVGEGVRGVRVCPVVVGKPSADFRDGFPDGALGGSEVRVAELEVLSCAGRGWCECLGWQDGSLSRGKGSRLPILSEVLVQPCCVNFGSNPSFGVGSENENICPTIFRSRRTKLWLAGSMVGTCEQHKLYQSFIPSDILPKPPASKQFEDAPFQLIS